MSNSSLPGAGIRPRNTARASEAVFASRASPHVAPPTGSGAPGATCADRNAPSTPGLVVHRPEAHGQSRRARGEEPSRQRHQSLAANLPAKAGTAAAQDAEILAVTRQDGARAIGVSLLHEKRRETAGFHYCFPRGRNGSAVGGDPRGSSLVRACHAIKDCLATARARSDRRHTQTAPTLKRARQDHRSLNYARPPRDESIRADDPRFACGSDL
jgi:hypothetical protein